MRIKTTVMTVVVCAGLVAALAAADVNDWPSHDRDAGGQRFSPLKQITPANVAHAAARRGRSTPARPASR